MIFLLKTVIVTAAILIVSCLFPGLVRADNLAAAFVGAFILGGINAVVKPILIILTLPVTIMTLGFFLLIINGLMLALASAIVPGFQVGGFWGAVIGAGLISLISGLLSMMIS